MKKYFIILCFTLFFIVFFWNNASILKTKNHFIPFKNLPIELTEIPKILVSPNNQILSIENNIATEYPLNFPFIDYDGGSLFVNYDNNRRLSLYHNNDLIFSSSESIGYPRLASPYILYFSKDLTSIDVAHFNNPNTILFSIVTNDLISTWDSSPNGNYLIIGNLSGEIFIYNKKTGKVNKKQMNKNLSFINSIGIENSGLYYAIGEETKTLIYDKDSTNNSHKEKIEIKSEDFTGKPIKTKNYIFFPTGNKGFVYFQKGSDEIEQLSYITPKFNRLFLVKEITKENPLILLGYWLSKDSYYFEIVHKKGKFIHSFYINSAFIPIFLQNKKEVYILYEKGAYNI